MYKEQETKKMDCKRFNCLQK